METKRNNRAYGEPLPVEPKRGKHRVKKDKNFCNRLKGEHSLVVDGTLGRADVIRWVITRCQACGKKEWHHMDSPEQEKAFYGTLAETGNVPVC